MKINNFKKLFFVFVVVVVKRRYDYWLTLVPMYMLDM